MAKRRKKSLEPKLKPLEDDRQTQEFVGWYKEMVERQRACPCLDFGIHDWSMYHAARSDVWRNQREALEAGLNWRAGHDWKAQHKLGLTLGGLLAKRNGKVAGYMTELAERGLAMLTRPKPAAPEPEPEPRPPGTVRHLFSFAQGQKVEHTAQQKYGFVCRKAEAVTWMCPIPGVDDYFMVIRNQPVREEEQQHIKAVTAVKDKALGAEWKRIKDEGRIIGSMLKLERIKREQKAALRKKREAK